MLGQVAFHVLAAAHASRAPWPIVVLVSCMPVVTLGFGAALTHPLRSDAPAAEHTATAPDTAVPAPRAALNGHAAAAVELFSSDLVSGALPSIRRIRREVHVGQPRAVQVRAYLAEIAPDITRSIAVSGAPTNLQVTGAHMGDG